MKKLLIMCACVTILGFLTVSAFAQDSDGDGIPDSLDNCPTDYNPLQEDTYPPEGNACGDACECEGNFDGDRDQDPTDLSLFVQDFQRTDCSNGNPCNGDFDCDGDVDGSDQILFVQDYGRVAYFNPCPTNCVTVPWCTYDECSINADCDDSNSCTDDVCNVGLCEHTNNTDLCNDGNECTENDYCENGSCQPGASLNCDDDNVCTDDACDPAIGCVYDNNSATCNDDFFCNGVDFCSLGQCEHPGNPCTPQQCDEVLDTCVAVDDSDNDGIPDSLDNCPTDYNPLQEDTYPPEGNACGDSCECEGNFDGDDDQDGTDLAIFHTDLGRTDCTTLNPCNGDFDCDGDVDDDDQIKFGEDFNRSTFMNPCPLCVTEPWCVYDRDDDGVPDGEDNCPEAPNGPNGGTCTLGDYNKLARPCMDSSQCGTDGFCSMNQEETDGDGIGDACDLCEGNFDCDADCDGLDLTTFLGHFGRGQYDRPCTNLNQCKGDFLCDGDVDGEDVTKALECFGRGQYFNPCPECPGGDWCSY